MKNILHIISSARGNQSYSKGLSSAIVQKLQQQERINQVIIRNLMKDIPPYADEISIHEFYKNPGSYDEKSTALLSYANKIVDEMREADIIVIGTPMFNLGISTPLKGWLDQLIRAGVTYVFDEQWNRVGQFKGKKVYLAIASGGRRIEGTPDYISAYLKDVFRSYTGITDVETYRIEGTIEPGFEANYDQILGNFEMQNI
ncbi:FMN-dependent NADH-azoreductase [Chryseobacterium lactis]|uniref:FMN dependent NADH:quinone oxidoreductase n=1 Tax=Chryseobacterium lactis TaxID=1241981 RepID=A0A3G6RCG7_CHRLC|nr:NAD(P)H-dependent oxidoreductase [Chryseobacterium lactis]AZA82360.1 FMN-dependent NADH-azoreductase [Chryseobacterium lactis]AZB02742.1 FMN-dependent NADH-azoreductase [Chryseobacterium lactis]PNW13964.1 FMN-dependent NADH-azoreductase [Chryseobacterium lactis]